MQRECYGLAANYISKYMGNAKGLLVKCKAKCKGHIKDLEQNVKPKNEMLAVFEGNAKQNAK